jgi:hypothetical protein
VAKPLVAFDEVHTRVYTPPASCRCSRTAVPPDRWAASRHGTVSSYCAVPTRAACQHCQMQVPAPYHGKWTRSRRLDAAASRAATRGDAPAGILHDSGVAIAVVNLLRCIQQWDSSLCTRRRSRSRRLCTRHWCGAWPSSPRSPNCCRFRAARGRYSRPSESTSALRRAAPCAAERQHIAKVYLDHHVRALCG